MRSTSIRRGKPLVALFMVVAGWTVARALLWDTVSLMPRVISKREASAVRSASVPRHRQAPPGLARDSETMTLQRIRPRSALPVRFAGSVWAAPAAIAAASDGMARPSASEVNRVAEPEAPGIAAPERTPRTANLATARSSPLVPVGRESTVGLRWSADGWMLLRKGGNGLLPSGAPVATYGASQAGAVVRYRFSPADGHRSAAYLRATVALGDAHDSEAAFGFAARPVPALPLVAAVEARVADRQRGVGVRPAVMTVTEIAPFDLPAGVRGEAYAQAGYVGGRDSTAFIDGHFRADRAIARTGPLEVRAGAGAWGGAQDGASRLDIGPTASVRIRIGVAASARLAVDWRFRLTGNASPGSGPALTLSAGF